jgi:hypothetical protein
MALLKIGTRVITKYGPGEIVDKEVFSRGTSQTVRWIVELDDPTKFPGNPAFFPEDLEIE